MPRRPTLLDQVLHCHAVRSLDPCGVPAAAAGPQLPLLRHGGHLNDTGDEAAHSPVDRKDQRQTAVGGEGPQGGRAVQRVSAQDKAGTVPLLRGGLREVWHLQH